MPFTTNAVAPTADEIFAESKLTWGTLGYADPTALAGVVEAAIGYVTWITGRYFDDFVPPGVTGAASGAVTTDFTPTAVANSPELISLMRRAVRMTVEQQAKQDQPGYIDTATDDLVQSFNAGPYSETRRDPTRRGEQKTLNTWPGLNSLLWQLMTDERREYWIMVVAGGNVPAFSVEEVDWSLVGKTPLFGSANDPMAPIGRVWWE